MRIAILGWGSLLWEGGEQFDQWHDPWQYDGPTLKLEFSRISEKRLGALTLVVDEEYGTLTTVAWCRSRRVHLDDAVSDLRDREGTILANIGRIVVRPGGSSDGHTANEVMLSWARLQALDAVIWTALRSNFQDKTQLPFSADAAASYVRALRPEAKTKAAEYVRRAPEFVKTPVRSALQRELRLPQVAS